MVRADEHFVRLQPGTVVSDRYEVVKCIGVGSMGTAYACRHRELSGHLVALKVLFPEVARDRIAAARFRNEIFASYGVSHPNVVRAYEYIRDGDLVGYTMEYIGGGDLADRLARNGELIPVPEAVKLLMQTCSGVQAIHDAGIVHRDLKPENILLTKDGNVKIADFGIARTDSGPRLTEHGGVVGTIDYVSPEYMLNSQVDWRSDIYALGIISFELVTGESPFKGDSVYATMTKRLKTDPPAPSSLREECSAELDKIILKAMARDPEARYQSAAAMFYELRSLGDENAITAGSYIQISQHASTTYVGPSLDTPEDEDAPGKNITGEEAGVGNENIQTGAIQDDVLLEENNRTGTEEIVFTPPPSIESSSLEPESIASPVETVVSSGPLRSLNERPTEVISSEAFRSSEEKGEEEEAVVYHERMESVLSGFSGNLKQEDDELKPTVVSVSSAGIDDSRVRKLSQLMEKVDRSIWADIFTLFIAVFVGVAAGFLVVQYVLPGILPEKAAQAVVEEIG